MLNYDWLLSGEAVDAVGAGRSGDASLGYSSWGWVTGWFQAGQSQSYTDTGYYSTLPNSGITSETNG